MTATTKQYTVYKMEDPRGQDGYMYKADGPAIRQAIQDEEITENDTWDPSEEELFSKLHSKGAI